MKGTRHIKSVHDVVCHPYSVTLSHEQAAWYFTWGRNSMADRRHEMSSMTPWAGSAQGSKGTISSRRCSPSASTTCSTARQPVRCLQAPFQLSTASP